MDQSDVTEHATSLLEQLDNYIFFAIHFDSVKSPSVFYGNASISFCLTRPKEKKSLQAFET